ncbi:hypothetical protein CEP54_015518 [Fusarium duplospermum]|uniref:Uncharacterized protein n=1 Tax=Fusarium duplospermum TaxID=1325734 RepID=A0A428NNG8_9HYPO|nr:hypothetical protein CEP54_015518 [Fusarium duplospermum]
MSPNLDFVPMQAAFSISAFDITQSGDIIIRGREERFRESRLRDSLPPQEPSTTRVLILESPFSLQNPGVQEHMPNWLDQFKERPPRDLDYESLNNLWSGMGSNDPIKAFWVTDALIMEKKTFKSKDALLSISTYLRPGYLRFGRHEWSKVHEWRCASSVNTEFLENNRVQDQYHGQDSNREEIYVDPSTGIPSPLKCYFLRLLLSQKSATKILPPTAETASMAVTLDLLRARVSCWTHHLESLYESVYAGQMQSLVEYSSLRRSLNIESLLPAISNLELQLRYTHASLLLKVQDRDDMDAAKLKWLELEIDTQLRRLQICLQHWLSVVDAMANISSTITSDRQARGVNRLALLAAIFLPVSLASSLLSMNVRAADLGPLWYDYFGLALIIMSLVALLYLCILLQDTVRTIDWGVIDWGVVDLRAIQLLGGAVYGLKTRIMRSNWRAMKVFIFCCFWAVVVTSFCLGMTRNVTLGLHILGYGTAGFMAIIVPLCFLEIVVKSYGT